MLISPLGYGLLRSTIYFEINGVTKITCDNTKNIFRKTKEIFLWSIETMVESK